MIQVAQDVQAAQTAPPEWVREELGGATGKGVTVAVLDSGWDRGIEDDRVLAGTGFVDPDDDFAVARNDDDQDVLGHGTACAGVILEVAPDARVIPVKVFGNKLETSPGTLEAALMWAIESGVQVINVSLGTRLEGTLQRLYVMCERARQAGIIVVAAAHNGNEESYPAIFEPVIGVSAARFDSPYHFRYRPDHAHECEGWGVERPVLWIGGERVVRHGTSFAAPGVAGIVALIRERFPQATLEDVRQMLARFALPGEEGEAPAAPSKARRTRAAKPADKAAATKPAKASRKRAAEPAPAAETKARKRATAKPAATAPSAPAKAPRKRAASAGAPAAVADTKPRKRTPTPAKVADQAVPATMPRKRTAASTKAADTAAPSKAGKAPRKQTTASTKAADTAASVTAPQKRAATAAKAADTTAPSKAAAKPRKRASTEAAPAAPAAKPKRPSIKAADTVPPAKAPAKRRVKAKA